MINRIIKWFKASNRYKHLVAGLLIYVVLVGIGIVLGVAISSLSVLAVVTTFIAMLALEYKDKAHAGVFDWMDIVAGVIIPAMISLAVFVLF